MSSCVGKFFSVAGRKALAERQLQNERFRVQWGRSRHNLLAGNGIDTSGEVIDMSSQPINNALRTTPIEPTCNVSMGPSKPFNRSATRRSLLLLTLPATQTITFG